MNRLQKEEREKDREKDVEGGVRSEAARLALGAIVDHNAAVMRPKR